MERTARFITVTTAAVILLTGIVYVVWQYNSSSLANSARVYYTNPLIGKYPYIHDAKGFLASNGFAYSYVVIDTNIAWAGAIFIMRPSLNVQIPSFSNFTAEVAFLGVNATSIYFEYYLPALRESIGTFSSGVGSPPGGGTSCSSGTGVTSSCLYSSYQGFPNLTFFLYLGPENMPPPP